MAALHILGGAEASPGLESDLARFARLPEAAIAGFGAVVEWTLPDPIPDRAEALLDAFATQHGISRADLALATRGVRFALRSAASHGVPLARFEEDLVALGIAGPAMTALVALFEPAVGTVRAELVARSIADHGKVLQDAAFRVDTIGASNHGQDLRAPVVVLTLRYEEDGERRSITLNAVPSTLKRLRTMLDAILA